MISDDFKWKYFVPIIILLCLRWYGLTPQSYTNVRAMLAERGILVHRSSIYRWFTKYAPILHKNSKNISLFMLFSSGN